MFKRISVLAFALMACVSGGSLLAMDSDGGKQQMQVKAAVEASIRNSLRKALPAKVVITKIAPSSMSGMYNVELNGSELIFVSGDGRFIFDGAMLEMTGSKVVNLGDEFYATGRQESLASVPDQEMIIFPAQGEAKGVVYAFTDVDCGYCKKFHQEIPRLSALGVEVRYLAWPRSGPNDASGTYQKMKKVWCSKDRKAAMTAAKTGQALDAEAPGCQTPIGSHFALGQKLGIRGTPALFLGDGRKVGGYRSANELAGELNITLK
ncbi:MAG: hypothetical protein COB04_14870 [Gammaproteobacteria bacterium]|nr:MAG: hypothetical protein COB04_14870 [Gammaproteobacteria bacterium]